MNDENNSNAEEQEQEQEQEQKQAMLNAIEARILGTLMEKQLTTPEQYPLTLNSLVTGCNQKTSREPVTNYTRGEIENCLNKLRDRKLVELEYGSRASRFDQRLSRNLYLDKPAQAVLTIMLLRGPQTVSELLNRSDRMYRFQNPAAVQDLLTTLCQKTAPIFVHLPRQSGQREDRYMHLLCGKPDVTAFAASKPTGLNTMPSISTRESDLIARVEELEQQLAKVISHLGLDGS